MKPSEDAITLLKTLHRSGNYGYYWRSDNKQTTWFDCKDPAQLPTNENIYFGIHPINEQKNGRGTSETVQAINCLYAEFDAKDFDNDKDAALNHILDLEINPSACIDSGGGYHCYWFLTEPVLIDDDNREEIDSLQKEWVKTVNGDPGAADLARVLRIPDTWNMKYQPKRKVEKVWLDPENNFTLHELENLIQPETKVQKPAAHFAENIRIFSAGDWKESLAYWTDKALDRARPGNRDNTGVWLAAQLRDAGLTPEQAMSSDYPEKVPQTKDGYTGKDWERTCKSIYRGKRRDPAKNLTAPAPEPLQRAIDNEVKGMKIQTAVENNQTKPDAPAADINMIIAVDSEERNELGDAELFATIYQGQTCYDHALKQWFLWEEHCWKPDKKGLPETWVMNHISRFYFDGAKIALEQNNKDAYTKLTKRAFALRSKRRADNVLSIAQNQPGLALAGDEWDADPWLLGVSNGVIDLRTGEFRAGRPIDYIRSNAPHKWMGIDAPAPRFEKFMLEIFNQDQNMVDFMQRLLGYGISGSTEEHVLPILYGPDGRNGKSTLLETLGSVLGDELAISSQSDAIMDVGTRGDGPRPFVFALQGKRLVWTSESNEGRRLNAGLVKQLTGGDRLNVRTLHSKPIQFKPSHLLMIITNHRPHINADDAAIWDRVYLIPFDQRFVDNPIKHNEKKAEKNLKEKLENEAPGILAWLVRGCLAWQREGLNAPEKIKAATEEYQLEEDTIGQFILECCETGPNMSVKGAKLYDAYKTWATEGGDKPMSKNAFGQRMKKRFGLVPPKNFVNYGGIGLRSTDENLP
jgi:putative DNA primase/helicase